MDLPPVDDGGVRKTLFWTRIAAVASVIGAIAAIVAALRP